jgi:hypothetical protein
MKFAAKSFSYKDFDFFVRGTRLVLQTSTQAELKGHAQNLADKWQ